MGNDGSNIESAPALRAAILQLDRHLERKQNFPLSPEQYVALAQMILDFFDIKKNPEYREQLRLPSSTGTQLHLLSGRDFQSWLIAKGMNHLAERPFDLARILRELEIVGYLTDCGWSGHSEPPLNKNFLTSRYLSAREARSTIWAGELLDFPYLVEKFRAVTAYITGSDKNGDVHGGSGLLCGKKFVLTCAHVLMDLKTLASTVRVGDSDHHVKDWKAHPKIDVGYIELSDEVRTPASEEFSQALEFEPPSLLRKIATVGRVAIPQAEHPAFICHVGEVVGAVKGYTDKNSYFLISALSRPGNSGGPVILRNGRIAGLVTRSFERQKELHESHSSVPYFAAVPTPSIVQALKELNPAFPIFLPQQRDS